MGNNEDVPPVSPVGDESTVQSEKEDRYEAEQTEQTEFEGISGEFEDLPGDCDVLNLGAEDGDAVGNPEHSEVTVAKCLEGESAIGGH
jgi:hypothetical protein